MKIKIYRIDIATAIIVLTIVVTSIIMYSKLYEILLETRVLKGSMRVLQKQNELTLAIKNYERYKESRDNGTSRQDKVPQTQ